MAQNIIDTGQAANDGTGEPLRQAFTAINNNFSNIWAQGPVDSQVVISNNTVTTNETNLDLVLSANGIGNVTVNSTVVPGVNSVYDLGAADAQFDTVWARYYNAGTGNFSGDVTVNGNLTVVGNTIQIGNITTETKTIQLSNAASTANAADGSGVTVGANDNIATMLYSSTSNTWVMNIGANITGNVTAPYFIGNGSQLTGITSYANANAVAYANSGWAGNIIPSADNTYSLGNATNQWNDLYVSNATIYMNNIPVSLTAGNVLTVNGQAILSNDSNTTINTTGNITADYFFGDGSQLTGIQTTGNIEFLGTTMYIDPDAPDTQINISPDGEGWAYLQLPTNSTANVTNTRLHNDAGNVEIGTGDFSTGSNSYEWMFGTNGTLTFPASQTSIFGGLDNDFTIDTANTGNATYTFTFGQFGDLSVPVNLNVSGNVYTDDIVGTGNGNITVTANTQSWLFDNNGTITLPGNSQILPAGNTGVRLSAGASDATGLFLNNTGDAELYANSNVSVYTDGGNIGWTFDNTGNLALPNNGSINFAAGGIVQAADENFTILVQDADDDDFSVYLNVDDGAGTILSSYRQQRDRYQLTFSTGNVFQFNDNGTLVLPPNAGVWTDAYSNVSIIARSVTDTSFVEMMTQDNSDIKRSNVTVTRDNVTVTTSSGGYNWTFGVDGTFTPPTLTVDIHNGGNQQAQTLQFGDNTQQAIITGPTPDVTGSAQRLIIQGQRGSGTGEGGDVYLWGGDSDLYGGDIKIYAGDADNVASGSGGYVNIAGGDGFDLGGYVSMTAGQSSNGAGASASVTGGSGATQGGSANINGGYGSVDGGHVTIQGGFAATSGNGGNINIIGGGSSSNGLPGYGNIIMTAGASTLTLDNTGNLTIPNNVLVAGSASPAPYISGFSSVILYDYLRVDQVEIANNAIYTSSGGSANLILNPQYGVTTDSYIQVPTFQDGGEQLVIKNRYGSSQGIRLETETGNFVISSNSITFPDSTVQSTAYTGPTYGDSNVTTLLSSLGANIISGTGNITTTGNISANYFIGNGSQLTGLPASYGDSNVATFLAAYGSNTISTTGNVTSGNLITAGSVNVAGNVNLTGAEGSDTARIFTDVSGSDTSLVLEVGDDNGDDIVLRHYSFAASTALDMLTATRVSNTAANISVAGNLNAVGGTFSGNVTADNFVGNISLLGNVTGTSSNVTLVAGSYSTVFDNTGTATFPGAMQLAVYANTTVRDSSITSPQPGMMIYVSGTGMQVRGATSWNTIAGSGT